MLNCSFVSTFFCLINFFSVLLSLSYIQLIRFWTPAVNEFEQKKSHNSSEEMTNTDVNKSETLTSSTSSFSNFTDTKQQQQDAVPHAITTLARATPAAAPTLPVKNSPRRTKHNTAHDDGNDSDDDIEAEKKKNKKSDDEDDDGDRALRRLLTAFMCFGVLVCALVLAAGCVAIPLVIASYTDGKAPRLLRRLMLKKPSLISGGAAPSLPDTGPPMSMLTPASYIG